jgi:hypothetical protein
LSANTNNNNNPNPPASKAGDYDYNPDDEMQQTPLNQTEAQPKSAWDKYLDSLDQSRLQQVIELARLNKYTIAGQEFQRLKIKNRQFFELERMRGRFNKEKDPEKGTDLLIDIYVKCAEYYLGMSAEQFDEFDWEETKPILDACNYRSVRGLPSSPKPFNASGAIT